MTGGWGDKPARDRARVGVRTMTAIHEYQDAGLTDADLVRYAKEALTRPPNAMFRDSRLWVTWTHMFSTPDIALTTDHLLGWSNVRRITEDLQARWPKAVEEQYVASWTYSRLRVMAIQVIYANGEIHPAFATALAIGKRLAEQYPVYDEMDFSALEAEHAEEGEDDADA